MNDAHFFTPPQVQLFMNQSRVDGGWGLALQPLHTDQKPCNREQSSTTAHHNCFSFLLPRTTTCPLEQSNNPCPVFEHRTTHNTQASAKTSGAWCGVCWWFILAKHFVLLTCRGLETLAVLVLKCAKWFAGTATTAGTHTPSTKRTPAFWCLHLCTTSNRRTSKTTPFVL